MLAETHLSDLYAFQFGPQVVRKGPPVDTETDTRARRVVEKFTESVSILTAEPSMGLYRIQEHVRRTLPQLVDKKLEVQGFQQQVEGVCYDLEYSVRTIQSMQKIPHFTIIKECLKSAMISKKNIEEAEILRQQTISAPPPVQIIQSEGEILSEGFICPICMEKWNSQEELLDHWKYSHSPSVSPSDSSSSCSSPMPPELCRPVPRELSSSPELSSSSPELATPSPELVKNTDSDNHDENTTSDEKNTSCSTQGNTPVSETVKETLSDNSVEL